VSPLCQCVSRVGRGHFCGYGMVHTDLRHPSSADVCACVLPYDSCAPAASGTPRETSQASSSCWKHRKCCCGHRRKSGTSKKQNKKEQQRMITVSNRAKGGVRSKRNKKKSMLD
jgi:hypothetical protein